MLINGIIHVTGEPDTGKTTFALEAGAQPEDIWFVDDDVKGRATVEEFRAAHPGRNFGRYDDLTSLAEGKREVEFHEACKSVMDTVKPGQFKLLIWDTWTRFAKTCHPYVVANPSRFRLKWSAQGRIKGGEQWQEAHKYEAQILNHLQKVVPTVVVVTHLKDFYLNNAKTDKKIPACSRALVRVPRLRIWLRHNSNSPVPIGLILKRPNKKIVTENGLRTVNILPRKIVPGADEQSLWDVIMRYYEEPIGLRKPTLDEVPDDFELSILDGTLTEDQRRTLHLMLQAGAVRSEVETSAEESADEELVQQILSSHEAGKTYAVIARELEMNVPEVVRIVKRAKRKEG